MGMVVQRAENRVLNVPYQIADGVVRSYIGENKMKINPKEFTGGYFGVFMVGLIILFIIAILVFVTGNAIIALQGDIITYQGELTLPSYQAYQYKTLIENSPNTNIFITDPSNYWTLESVNTNGDITFSYGFQADKSFILSVPMNGNIDKTDGWLLIVPIAFGGIVLRIWLAIKDDKKKQLLKGGEKCST
jgi:hypothetical protein